MKTKISTKQKNSNGIKPVVSGSQIWASDERTNERVDRIMWYVDNVMMPKFYLR